MLLRFLLIQSLMLWQGGFLFYAIIVVPIGSDVIGALEQGFITQRVTFWLNVCGAVTLHFLALDVWMDDSKPRYRPILRNVCVVANFAIFLELVYLRDELYWLLNFKDFTVIDAKAFYRLHVLYLTLSGLQWFLMLLHAWITLCAWRYQDRNVKSTAPHPEPP